MEECRAKGCQAVRPELLTDHSNFRLPACRLVRTQYRGSVHVSAEKYVCEFATANQRAGRRRIIEIPRAKCEALGSILLEEQCIMLLCRPPASPHIFNRLTMTPVKLSETIGRIFLHGWSVVCRTSSAFL